MSTFGRPVLIAALTSAALLATSLTGLSTAAATTAGATIGTPPTGLVRLLADGTPSGRAIATSAAEPS